jgi:lipoprotein-anchoring transpeptidase ErfK/SrfK
VKTIRVDINSQRLTLLDDKSIIYTASVSTAKNGAGEVTGSEKTPRGWHCIRAKIGSDAITNTVFVGRRPTGEIYSPDLRNQHPNRDWILTRILWLSGLEPGFNRLRQVDTMRRYIYIHGCPDEDEMGTPSSHGCIKMRNEEIIELFNLVEPGMRIYIVE